MEANLRIYAFTKVVFRIYTFVEVKNYEQNATFRADHFGLEIQTNKQVQFSMLEIPCAVQISGPWTVRI
jgi:hypothetical protein